MKPWEQLGQTRLPDGSEMRLAARDDEFVIFVDGAPLMSSRMHGSEEALATLGCRHASTRSRPRILVGGLGMGFTLRATLDLLPADASVVVAELMPAVVEWNHGPLAPLAGRPLQDPRVRVAVADVGATLRTDPERFDAILLDVDNSPTAFTTAANKALYDRAGIAAAWAALRQGGVLAIWSDRDDRAFEGRLRRQGFTTRVEQVRARLEKGGARHRIILGVKR